MEIGELAVERPTSREKAREKWAPSVGRVLKRPTRPYRDNLPRPNLTNNSPLSKNSRHLHVLKFGSHGFAHVQRDYETINRNRSNNGTAV